MTRARRQQRRRRTIVGVTACVVAIATVAAVVTATDHSPTPKVIAPAESSSQSSFLVCPNARQPRFGEGDGLPPKGYTDKSYVGENLTGARSWFADMPGVLAVGMEPRHGEVWSHDVNGAVQVEQLDDWQLAVELDSTTRCPSAPNAYNGTPVEYLAHVPRGTSKANVDTLRWSILRRNDSAALTSLVADRGNFYAEGSLDGGNVFGTASSLELLRLGESWGLTNAHVYATPGGFYLAGSVELADPLTGAGTGVHRAHVIKFIPSTAGGPGFAEANSGSFLAASGTPTEVASEVAGIAGHDNTTVAVGEVFSTDNSPSGALVPAIWIERPDTSWERHLVALDTGFDAHMTGIRWWRGQWVAEGVSGGAAVTWTSDDLQHWGFHRITRRGAATISEAGNYLFASGWSQTPAGPAPTVWRSPDGKHWNRVLDQPATPGQEAGFRTVARVGTRYLAISVANTVDGTGPKIYQSTNGRTWNPMAGQSTVLPSGSSVTGFGTVQGQLVLAGQRPDNGLGPDNGEWPVLWVVGRAPR